MNKSLQRILAAIMMCALALALQPLRAQAFPPLPASFYGKVKLNGANVAAGTLIEALINGSKYAQGYTQMYQGDSVYTITIPGDDPGTAAIEGGKEGDTITFTIGGIAAQQSGTWRGGSSAELDLSGTSSVEPNTPAPTPTTRPTQTAIPTVNPPTSTPTATLTPAAVNPTQAGGSGQSGGAATQPPAGMTALPAGESPVVGSTAQSTAAGADAGTGSVQPQAAEKEVESDTGAAAAEKPSSSGIILLGAGILLALLVVGWLFYRQMQR